MLGTAGRLALVFPASSATPGRDVCSALAWPGHNALLKAPTGVAVELVATLAVGSNREAAEPLAAEALGCLRWSIQTRIEHLHYEGLQREFAATEGDTSARWLRLAGQGRRGQEGMTLTLTVGVQHHLAYQAMHLALLHPPRQGFKVYGEPRWYSLALVEKSPVLQLLGAPKPKGKGNAPPPPGETQLIIQAFRELAFRGAAAKGAVFQPHRTCAAQTRWHVAACEDGANPLAAPAPPTEMWPAGTQVYEPSEGKFVLTLDGGRPAGPVGPVTQRKREVEEGGEERWIMIDDFGNCVRASELHKH